MIVITVGGVIALRVHFAHELRMRAVQAHGSPTVGRNQPPSTVHPGPLGAEAPWALSALPECWLQQNVWRAHTLAGLRAHLPVNARAIAPGAVLVYRNCTLQVRADDAVVTRGNDRFHIPPHSHFFSLGDELIFVRQNRAAELRIYKRSNLQ
ncbi:MAG: hypothetical protein JO193_00920 [Candidatus Eremiobacteraeota bacterium]|nr:hypothetical protein [Candidatus Eremiobacteraeota bacterium]